MRLLLPSVALAAVSFAPSLVLASPFAISLSSSGQDYGPPAKAADGSSTADTGAPTMGDTAAPAAAAEPAAAPADDPAAGEAEPPAQADPAAGEAEAPADEEVPVEGPEEVVDPTTGDPTQGEVLDDEEDEDLELGGGPVKKGDFNANAFGVRTGIYLAPSWILNKFLASYSNAMCRNEIGGWGEQNGLIRVDGCNYYVTGEYVRRVNRAFDIGVGAGYLHAKLPDSLWIDNGEWDRDTCTEDEGQGSNCNLGAADYTEIDLRMVTVEVNFTGRGTLYRDADVEVQLGGGGGLGLGILIGEGVRRTPLGRDPSSPDDPDSCRTLSDLADFTRCTPRYYNEGGFDDMGNALNGEPIRDEVDMNGEAPAGTTSTGTSFARCSEFKCDGSDLAAFGATETDGTWPVYPVINIFGSFRVIIKDTFGISIEGGIKDGFFFGGGAHFFFGGGGKNRDKDKAKTKSRPAPAALDESE